ncbi:zinc finger protein basonuclin-2 isoform X1 [Erpetoichthys calabaricus]|nr:zinc finger protein basonuclin-2 isoform X1 [Erpetoichthys calabaricus]
MSEEAEVDVRHGDTQRDKERERARDLTLRDKSADNSMQFGTRSTSTEPGFMGTWQNSDSNLLFRMSQQAIRCTLVNCTCECFQPGKINLRTCDQCKHGWVAHALDKLSTQHLYHPTQVEIVQSNVVFDISSLMLYGTQAVPVRLKILLDRLFSVLKQEEVLHILHGLGWTLRDYVRGYILQDAAGKVLDRWAIMSREEEIITLQQFLRFGETKSIVELMAIQEKEGQAVIVPSSKADSDIRTFIESNNRTRSPSLLSHLENSNPSSIHHFENIPNSLAFLLPFQYINPVSAPLLGLPPNGLMLEQPGLRLREPNLPAQSEANESSESEVSVSPFRSGQSPNRSALSNVSNVMEPKSEPNNISSMSPTSPPPQQSSNSLNDHHLVKTEQSKSISSSFSSKIHRMRRMGSTSRKGRVCCNACGKTFYDKGTLKIHYNAVHLKIKHRCTIEGCNMVFSSLRSRNRHSANPNPRLHMPMLRNNRDKDLIRASSGSSTPVISSTKSSLTLTSPGRPPMGFTTPPLDPVLQSPLQSPIVFSSLKTVQPVPPFYRSLLSPGEMVSPPVSLPTSPVMPSSTTSTASNVLLDQQPQVPSSTHPILLSEATSTAHSLVLQNNYDTSIIDPTPKKKPRKSSMPVKIEKEIINVAEDFDEEDDEGMENEGMINNNSDCPHLLHNHHNHHHPHSINNNHCQHSSQDEMSPSQALKSMLRQDQDDRRSTGGGSEMPCMGSFTSEEQDHDKDFENDSEASETKMCCGDPDSMESEDLQRHHHHHHHHHHHSQQLSGKDRMEREQLEQEEEDNHLREKLEDKHESLPSPHQPVIKIKEELTDPTYDMFYMSQYGLYNGGAVAAAASMAALHESFVSSMGFGGSTQKYSSPEGDLCSSPDPKICYVCKKSFKSSYSVKLHYKNVHLKEMHVCTVAGCNAAFPSRRSRDRHSANINLHRKLLTKELDEMGLETHHTPLPRELRDEFLAKIYGGHPLGFDGSLGRDESNSPAIPEYLQTNGYYRGPPEDCMVLDLSTTSSIQSSSSIHSSRESDEGSDEGILLDDTDGASDCEDFSYKSDGLTQMGVSGMVGQDGLLEASSTMLHSGSVGSGGIMCNICHKMYSNKGTLRVHYKTVHLREMHKCKVPGCNMMFSSVRSRNRHSQNPNLHKHVPFTSVVE